MNILKTSTAAVCIFIATCGASLAVQPVNDTATNYLDELTAKLINSGYSNVRVIDATAYRLSAFDKDGSEVMLVAHPTNRSVISSIYVHPSDQ